MFGCLSFIELRNVVGFAVVCWFVFWCFFYYSSSQDLFPKLLLILAFPYV